MKIGIANFPREMMDSVASTVAMVALAEAAGFHDAWIPDTQGLWKDPHVVLALAATRTQSIKLGLGVTNPVTRHPTVSARAIATVQEVSRGRVIFGIGAGDTSVKALSAKPAAVSLCAAYAAAVRSLVDGKETEYDGVKVRLENVSQLPRIPLYIAANGPKMLRLAGEMADGVIVPVGFTREFVDYVLHHVGEGLRAAGRTASDIDVVFLAGTSVSSDRAVARNQVRSYVAKRALVPVPPEVSGISAAEKEKFIKAYSLTGHMQVGASHADLVPESWIDRFALAGTAEEALAKIQELERWGGRHLLVMPAMPETAALIRAVGDEVIARLPKSAA